MQFIKQFQHPFINYNKRFPVIPVIGMIAIITTRNPEVFDISTGNYRQVKFCIGQSVFLYQVQYHFLNIVRTSPVPKQLV